MKDRRMIGLVLVAVGAISFASRFGWLSGEYFLMGIGAVFLIAYYIQNRSIGFLIPACILIALGLFVNIESGRLLFFRRQAGGALFFFFMALAFYMMSFLHRLGNDRPGRKAVWPVIVGTALTAFGVFVYGVEHWKLNWNLTRWLVLIDRFWPLILIAAGLFMVLKNSKES